MGSLPVSPPASDARREFSTDEKGCASRQSATDKGSASAGTEPRAPERQTIAPRSCLYAGIDAVFICAIRIYSHCDHQLSPRRYFVTNGDRIHELVVSRNRTKSSPLGLLSTVFNVLNLSGGGKSNSLNVLSVVSFK